MNRSLHFACVLSAVGALAQLHASAQCPEVLDPNGLATGAPSWADCRAVAPQVEVAPAADWTGVSINWGDGSPTESVTWTSGDAPLTHTYPDGAGSYSIALTDSGSGCTVTGTFDVVPPVANLIAASSQVCEGSSVNFQQTGTGGGQNLWNFGIGSTFIPTSNGVVSYLFNNPGVQTVTNIYVSNIDPIGCRDTSTVNILVKPKPEMEVTLSHAQSCGPVFVSGSASGADLANVVWSFAVSPYFAAGMEMPSTYLANTGANPISVTGIGANGCNTSVSRNVQIFPQATVAITAATGSACEGETAEFTGTASVPLGQSITSIEWDFGDGNTTSGLSAEHVFTEAGTYPVALTIETNLCTNTITESIVIESAPTVSLTASALSGCAPFDVAFTGSVEGASTYVLDLGEGGLTTNLNAAHSFSPAVHDIALTAQSSNGCTSTTGLSVEALAPATVSVVNVPGPACGSVDFPLETVASGAEGLVWSATNGWASTETMPQFALSNAGDAPITETLTVTAVAANGCDATAQVDVEVLPVPDFSFALTADTVCSPLQANLPSMPDAAAFTWNFGDGDVSTDDAPFHVWENATDDFAAFAVTFSGTNSYGCSATAEQLVHVKPQPMANFALSSLAGCDPLQLTFFNQGSQATHYALTTSAGQTLALAPGEQVDLVFTTGDALSAFDIELSATHALGCSDVRQETVEVYPNPTFDLAANIEAACTPYTVEFPAVEGALNTAWDFGDGTTAVAADASHTFENATNDLVTYQVSMVGTNGYGCAGSAVVDVPVKPMPVADFTLDAQSGCAPFGVAVTNTSSAGAAYAFAADNGAAWTAEPSESHALTLVGGADVQEAAITLTATHPLGCVDTRTQSVTVYPAAQFDFALAEDSACSPLTVALPTLVGASDWTWTFGDGTTAPATATEHTFTNDGNTLASFAVAVEGATAFGCTDHHEATVHVKPQPQAALTLDAASGCAPFQVTATNAGVLGSTYTLTTDAGLAYQVNEGEGQTFTFAGSDQPETRSITLTAVHALGCSDAATATLEVLPAAAFTFELPGDSACSPFELTTPTIPGAAQVNWRFDNGSPVTEPTTISWTNSSMVLESHIIEMEAINPFGCSNTFTQTAHVKPQPTASFTLSDDAGCAPFAVTLTNTSTQAESYHWDYGDDHSLSTAISGAHTFVFEGEAAAVTRMLKLVASHSLGCSDEHVEYVEVYPEVLAQATGVTSGCTPFDVEVAYEGAPMDQILWTVNGTAAGSGPTFTSTFAEGGDATLGMAIVSAHGCTDSVSLPVTAYASPEVTLAIDLEAACAGTPVTLTHVATGADDVAYTFSNGAALADPAAATEELAFENPFANPVTVTITQTASTAAGCVATAEVEHTVYPDVAAAFTAPEGACGPFEAQLVNTTADATDFAWTIGGEAVNGVSPLHTFANAGSEDLDVEVVLVAANGFGCADTAAANVTVFGTPQPTLSLVELTGCYPIEATFEATGGVSAVWTYGDEEPVAGGDLVSTHVFFNPYDQPIDVETTVEVANAHGCTATASLPLQVNPELTAQFDVVEAGCTPLELVLVNQTNGATSFEWSFGDGATSTATNPQHTLVNATPTDQTFVVELVAHSGYGCTDTLAVGVEVHPEPEAAFFMTPVEQTYPNASVTFTNLSTSGAGAVHTWTFGDGGSTNDVAPGVHHYGTWGTFDVTLDVDNGFCDHAVTQTVTIHPPAPVAAFSGEAEGCAPVDVAFTNGSEFAASVLWDFGDGATSTDFDPVHQYVQPGVYDVTLRVTGHQGLVEEVVHTAVVTVLPSPTALFEFAPYEVIAPAEEVAFIDLSSDDAIEYLWNFGDGTTSNEQHPRHSYDQAGLYTIALAVRNEFGCTDTHTYVDAIQAKPGGFMVFPTAFTPDLTGPNGGGYQLSDLDNDVFHPHHAGVDEYELSVFNIWGEMIFNSKDPMIGWDGYIHGLLAPQGTYVWKATARFSDGRRLIQSGDFTLIIN